MPTWVAIQDSAGLGAPAIPASFNPTWLLLVLAVAGALVAIGKWIGSVNTDRTSFKAFMAEMREDIKKILGYVGPSLSTNDSPVVLNALGKKVSEAMGIKAWAEETAPSLADQVAGLKEHRIYEFCTEHVEKMDLTEEQQDQAKALAYEHGFIPEKVRTAYAIELRDALLALQKEQSESNL